MWATSEVDIVCIIWFITYYVYCKCRLPPYYKCGLPPKRLEKLLYILFALHDLLLIIYYEYGLPYFEYELLWIWATYHLLWIYGLYMVAHIYDLHYMICYLLFTMNHISNLHGRDWRHEVRATSEVDIICITWFVTYYVDYKCGLPPKRLERLWYIVFALHDLLLIIYYEYGLAPKRLKRYKGFRVLKNTMSAGRGG